MIPDAERKTITILSNFFLQNKRMPYWHELERKTGRRKENLVKAINQLQKKRMLQWDGENLLSVRIDPGWRYALDHQPRI